MRKNWKQGGARRRSACVSLCAALSVAAMAVSARAAEPTDPLSAEAAPANAIWLDSLDLSPVTVEMGMARAGKNAWNMPMALAGVTYPHGLGVRGTSAMIVSLKGSATRFEAVVGIDDAITSNAAVDFSVEVDGRTLFDSGTLHGGDPAKPVSVDLAGAHRMVLTVTRENPEDSVRVDSADWAGALIRLVPGATALPETEMLPAVSQAPVYFPDSASPALHGPRALGLTTAHPFLYRLPLTGTAPAPAVSGLPAGLTFNPETAVISGQPMGAGTTRISVLPGKGAQPETLTLVCGERLAVQTPPMGWNAFGIYGDTVTDAQVRNAADALADSGLAAHGYRYICIGDTWEGARDTDGNIHPNRRFPNMKQLADYIHGKGLLFGLYSSATAQTCSGYIGSQGHEAQDAKVFADWGVDYLTYDWCPDAASADLSNAEHMAPAYAKMRAALDQSGRDIVLAATVQRPERYTSWNDDPATWAQKAGVDTFAATGGIFDSYKILMQYAENRMQFVGRGGDNRWNDLGPLMTGRIGYPKPHLTLLTPPEQMTQMTLWCLMSSPLFVSNDLEHLNPNLLNHDTTALLTNDEILAIDQEPHPHTPRLLVGGGRDVWMRALNDGRVAVALINQTTLPQRVSVRLADIGLSASEPVTDLWTHKDLGTANGAFEATVPIHGVVFVAIGRAKPKTDSSALNLTPP